jgi:predicted Rossmann fold nucleotide-binding protein DprA/Smf involved in DNA uptake
MPGGLDRPFPPENRPLWDELLLYPGAAFVSELGFGVRASALTLRKRNKLIVAFAKGVLVAQSAKDGGAMNAFRFAVEQKKAVATFAADDSGETSGNRAIAAETWTKTFPVDRPDPEAYAEWLRQLSSSMSMARFGTATPGTPRSLLD